MTMLTTITLSFYVDEVHLIRIVNSSLICERLTIVTNTITTHGDFEFRVKYREIDLGREPPLFQLTIVLLGAPQIEINHKPVDVDTRKAIALLAYLAINPQPHQREALSTLLWPDVDEAHGRAALRRTLSTLNKALDGPFLEASRDQIGLQAGAPVWVDVSEFRRFAAGCDLHCGAPQESCLACQQALARAAELYRGDFMQGFTLRDSVQFDDWQFFQSDSLQRELAAVLQKLASFQAGQGHFPSAIAYARRWLALDPLLEDAQRLLIQLYAWSGQRNAALRQYRECVRILEQELGVAPLEETTRLYQAVLEEGRLPLPPAHAPAAQPTDSDQDGALPGVQPVSRAGAPPYYPLVGRSLETSALLRLYQGVTQDGRLCILEGENGIGKTRLAQEFLAYAQANGAACLSARGYQGESDLAYGPLIEGLRAALKDEGAARLVGVAPHWLAEAARLLPELSGLFPGLPQPPSLGSPGAQNRFFEGLVQVLLALCAGRPPGILFFDDLHWADSASLDLLAYLVRRLPGHPVFMLLAWRHEPTSVQQDLEELRRQAQRAGAYLNLGRLTRPQVSDLVHQLAANGLQLPQDLDEQLYQESEGLPLFVVEYLTALAESQQAGGDWPMPPSVRQALQARLASVSEASWQVLSSAAVIGRSFDFDILREASARSEAEVVVALESLLGRGLISERPAGEGGQLRYDFSHNKLRDVVYEEISLARRRLLHRRVAEALANQARGQMAPGEHAGQIAHHYRLGGQELRAAEYFRQAGDYDRSLYANAEALEEYRLALALGYPQAGEVHQAIGELYTLQSDYAAAIQSYQAAAALSPPQDLSALEARLADVHHRLGDWKLAEGHLQSALELLEESGKPEQRAVLYASWSDIAHHQNQMERAQSLALRALELAESAGEPHALARAHNMLGILARDQSDFEAAIRHLQHSLEIAHSLGEGENYVAALNNLALAYGDAGERQQAIGLAGQALELCARQGDRHREAALHNNLADLYHAQGESEQAMRHLKQAVQIFAEIRVENEELKPGIWKLVEW
jgi:predicted ATPase/DNA-binding SARP family transcriptional activator